MRIQIRIKDDLTPKMKEIQARIRPNFQIAVAQSIKVIEKKAKANVRGRFRVKTGRLLSSIVAGAVKFKGNLVMAQLPGPYQKGSHWWIGRIHEKGAIIRPKKKEYLTIGFPDGTVRRVKQVILPKRPWLAPAWQASLRSIIAIFNRRIEMIFR